MWDRMLDRMLRGFVTKGALRIVYPDGEARRYGEAGAEPVTVRLADPSLPRRLVRNAELAVGEGYADGGMTIDGDDLEGFLTLATLNAAANGGVWWRRIDHAARYARRMFDQYNPAFRARRNVAHHYDLSGELYDLFLDADRQYSCAYFTDPSVTLEEAQAAKKRHIAGKLLLEPGMEVFEIGCGWGGMALTLARDHGVRVLGVTLSEEQHKVATRRAEAAGLSDRVRFELKDYRAVEGSFDRIVSVGMFEHVGAPHYGEYFDTVRERLAADGIALIHTIGRAAPPGTTSPWIAKYIFPGGYVPAMSEVARAFEDADLYPCDVEVWRLHYAETLRHWHDRFVANEDKARALYDARFCRMWRYYLKACEVTFRHNRQCVFQVQLARRQDAVPLTRDYLYPHAAEARLSAAE
ncbi:cyclopropane-fatty-acyl-phospholipid synthase [Roseibacterium sp. SDUM158017]|uniref:SAM-dependent methyltransferase n=1 Tax=Roseicyclus salinarum TaxID=3036773 RepID=UPI002414F93C|nr:cyclopropane-fatty-acyl-phospholipid synthase family protein [Roseibacterium sp. SDUM158017]MDG4650481.1 cyclopropane-fatty-acyl-phospholipid synthase [Roseibacterium sp. SDUM158017]